MLAAAGNPAARDREEVRLVAACPNRFLQSLYEKQYEKMMRFSYRMVGTVEGAQDLVQETFLIALYNQDKLFGHPNPEGWLMKTLRNRILNEQRRVQNHMEIPLDTVVNMLSKEQDLPLESVLPKQLSKEEREILIWRFERQMDYRDIADRLGISEAGCRSRVSRAVARCKKFLDGL